MRVAYDVMKETLCNILVQRGVLVEKAENVARILTDNTCDGVASHGVNRFLRVVEYMESGFIKVDVEPEIISSFGGICVMDGHFGLGMINAEIAMNEAILRAKSQGIGCVALRNNNHWMRGATYGIQATKADMIGICFTNTLPNMPAWGATESRIGNNPLVIAIPRTENPIVLDMAMSQFSYGKLETKELNKEELSLVGGYNDAGELTHNPGEILESGRILPTGYWKGSGLSIVLDMMATMLSGGLSTKDIGEKPVETGVSQIFIAIDPQRLGDVEQIKTSVKETIAYIKKSERIDKSVAIRYPGEGSAKTRAEQIKKGILVNDVVWSKILELQ